LPHAAQMRKKISKFRNFTAAAIDAGETVQLTD
jgi:hypothetical protein